MERFGVLIPQACVLGQTNLLPKTNSKHLHPDEPTKETRIGIYIKGKKQHEVYSTHPKSKRNRKFILPTLPIYILL